MTTPTDENMCRARTVMRAVYENETAGETFENSVRIIALALDEAERRGCEDSIRLTTEFIRRCDGDMDYFKYLLRSNPATSEPSK